MVMWYLFSLCLVRDDAYLFAYSSMLREWSTLRLADTRLILNDLQSGFYPTRDRFIFIRNGGLVVMDYCSGDEDGVSGQDKSYEQPTELLAGEPAYESNQRRYFDVHLWIHLPLWSWRMKLPQSKTKRYLQT
jgi:hypothetical protein